jgi:UTP--glucose-1-phosphate uridylyltransferase
MQTLGTVTVRKAVVPAAGLGTRHFPASHAVKKELFPVVGPDGIARALIHYHLIELAAAGIEQICIIVQPGEDKPIRDYLAGRGD